MKPIVSLVRDGYLFELYHESDFYRIIIRKVFSYEIVLVVETPDEAGAYIEFGQLLMDYVGAGYIGRICTEEYIGPGMFTDDPGDDVDNELAEEILEVNSRYDV